MSFSNSSDNKKDHLIFETVNKILTGKSVNLNERRDDSPDSEEERPPSLFDYAKAKASYIDDYEAEKRLRWAKGKFEAAQKAHLPRVKQIFDAALTIKPYTIRGEFVHPEFDEETASTFVKNKHMKEFKTEAPDEHVQSEVKRLRTEHEKGKTEKLRAHQEAKYKHEQRFDDFLGSFMSHPENMNHPLVTAAKELEHTEKMVGLATNTLPKFDVRNIAGAAGAYLHGRFTGKASEYSPYSRRLGAERHQEQLRGRKRPSFDIGTPGQGTDSGHAPR